MLKKAIQRTNALASVVQDDVSHKHPSGKNKAHAMEFRFDGPTVLHEETCSPPIFNYSRLFSWESSVDQVATAFRAASEQTQDRRPVDGCVPWKSVRERTRYYAVHPDNRVGTKAQVVAYCRPSSHNHARHRWALPIYARISIASVAALLLQWCTTGAAVLIMFNTPTRGLGCRSGSYLVYALASTVVWFIMVLSSLFAHYADSQPDSKATLAGAIQSRLDADQSRQLSVTLSTSGKVLATLNTFWVLCCTTLQFANVFNTCYCNSAVTGLGADKAFNVLSLTREDRAYVAGVWEGGVIMTLVSAGLFVIFVWVHERRTRWTNAIRKTLHFDVAP